MGANTTPGFRLAGDALNQGGAGLAPFRVLHAMAPARAGGLESVVVQLAAGLRDRGHDAQVATVLASGAEKDHPVVQALRDRGVPVHVLVFGTRDYLSERRAVRTLLHQTGASVLHTHGYRADAVLGDVARKAGRANVMTLHGFVGGSRRGRAYEWLQIQAARWASGVVAVSSPIVERLKVHGITRNVHLLRNAVTPAHNALERAEARLALKLPADRKIIGWVGRVSHEKGPDLFVEALARVPDPVHGAIVGDGQELEAAKGRARELGVSHRLHCLGMIAEASRYLRAFDGLALTSRTEGTPMILLESMWAGVPIVATAVGGVPDIVSEQEAVLCAPLDVEMIARAMSSVVQHPAAATLRAEAARGRVARDFAPEAWIGAHEALYRTLTESRASSQHAP